LQNGAWTPSLYPRGTDWTFDYNAACTVRAEELGFDLVFGLAQWHGAGGLGGEMRFRENTQDPLLVTAGLAALTHNIMLISTVHVLYGWSPLLLAKYAATLDHMSSGRWGLNVVTGIKAEDFEMFGLEPIEHDKRYEIADEFMDAMKQLWSSTENINFNGKHYQMRKGFVSPKPKYGRPVLVNASSSGVGVEFAAKHSDLLFITRPAGSDIYGLLKEAKARRQAFIDHADPVALDNFFKFITGGDTVSWKGAMRDDLAVGGNMQIVGTPEQVVEKMLKLHDCGIDGVQVNFYDYLPDLEYFGERVIPLMKEAGLRN
jgi:FMNH2-dependent dimethyl sulfone monooxygenase